MKQKMFLFNERDLFLLKKCIQMQLDKGEDLRGEYSDLLREIEHGSSGSGWVKLGGN